MSEVTKELISVIVPVYNVKDYLGRCVDSLIHQTYRNIEIILVDDGSTDGSSSICDEWKEKDERIRVIHKHNGGLSDARNRGIDEARAELLSFVDSDDYVDSRFLEILYRTMKENDADLSAVDFLKFWDKDGNVKAVYSDETEIMTALEAIETILDNEKFSNYTWNKLYKKEHFAKVRFPVGRLMEDIGTTYKILDQCERIAYNKSRVLFYYQRRNSIIYSGGDKKRNDMYELSRERFEYLNKKYPHNYRNYKNLLHMRMESHVNMPRCERTQSRKIARALWKEIKDRSPLKVKIKYGVFMISPRLCRCMLDIQQRTK